VVHGRGLAPRFWPTSISQAGKRGPPAVPTYLLYCWDSYAKCSAGQALNYALSSRQSILGLVYLNCECNSPADCEWLERMCIWMWNWRWNWRWMCVSNYKVLFKGNWWRTPSTNILWLHPKQNLINSLRRFMNRSPCKWSLHAECREYKRWKRWQKWQRCRGPERSERSERYRIPFRWRALSQAAKRTQFMKSSDGIYEAAGCKHKVTGDRRRRTSWGWAQWTRSSASLV